MTWSMTHRPSKNWYNAPSTRKKGRKKAAKAPQQAT
jgi:hypothetical protein